MKYHPLCLLLSYREEVVDELAELMTARGWYPQEHITLYEGQILDGRHRYLAAQKAGVEPQFMDFKGDEDAAATFVFGVNAMSRHFTFEEKKDYFINARNAGFWAKRGDGERHSVEETRQQAGGVPSDLAHHEIADLLGVSVRSVTRWESERVEPNKPSIRTTTSGNDEWYTPVEYIDMARGVMGGVDLDPASCEFAQKEIKAKTFYTREDDGLSKDWTGRVWLNPPYSTGLLDKFAEKIRDEYRFGEVDQAIVLTHSFTDTKWFHLLAVEATAICFTRGRVKFYNEDGVKNSPPSGHVFFYLGPNVKVFAEQFSEVGLICIPHGGH